MEMLSASEYQKDILHDLKKISEIVNTLDSAIKKLIEDLDRIELE